MIIMSPYAWNEGHAPGKRWWLTITWVALAVLALCISTAPADDDPKKKPEANSKSSDAKKSQAPVAPRRMYTLIDRSAKDRLIRDALEKRVDLRFQKTPLEDVVAFVKQATRSGPDDKGIPIYIDPIGLDEAEKTLWSPVSFEAQGAPLKESLERLLRAIGLSYGVKDGLLTITADVSLEEPMTLEQAVHTRGNFPVLLYQTIRLDALTDAGLDHWIESLKSMQDAWTSTGTAFEAVARAAAATGGTVRVDPQFPPLAPELMEILQRKRGKALRQEDIKEITSGEFETICDHYRTLRDQAQRRRDEAQKEKQARREAPRRERDKAP
jgi:hypothetical protein